MTGIFAHRTSKLLKLEDFKEARKQARNFREYFQEIRENHLRELQLRSQPPMPVVLEQDQGSQDFGDRVMRIKPLVDGNEQSRIGTPRTSVVEVESQWAEADEAEIKGKERKAIRKRIKTG